MQAIARALSTRLLAFVVVFVLPGCDRLVEMPAANAAPALVLPYPQIDADAADGEVYEDH